MFLDDPDRPLQPHAAELRYLIRRMEEEIARKRDVLDEASLGEFQRALETYRALQVSTNGRK